MMLSQSCVALVAGDRGRGGRGGFGGRGGGRGGYDQGPPAGDEWGGRAVCAAPGASPKREQLAFVLSRWGGQLQHCSIWWASSMSSSGRVGAVPIVRETAPGVYRLAH